MPFYRMAQICPQCGKPSKCSVREVSTDSVHYYDEYTFYCPSCNYTVKNRIEKGATYLGIRATTCPFCNGKSKDHQRTSKELSQSLATS